MRSAAFDNHFSRMFSGYLLAVLVAAANGSSLLILAVTVNSIGRGRPPLEAVGNAIVAFPLILLFAILIVFFAALPGWIAAATYAEWRSVRSLGAHVVFGALGAVPLVATVAWRWGPSILAIFASLICGCVGGAAYWSFVGRNAGAWREAGVIEGQQP